MSRINNFGRLNEDDESRFDGKRIEQNVWQTLGIFRFVGEVAEIYFSKMIDVLIAAVGGKTDRTEGSSSPPSSSPNGPVDPGKNAPGS